VGQRRIGLDYLRAAANPFAIAIAWGLTFAISAAVYYSFERPILKWRDRMMERRSKSVKVAAECDSAR
jgi:peptidoglycan/LPS O-acetylase OafA/YrhL